MANSNDSKYRVSLKFSEEDPDQKEVVELLKQMGRKKSLFITRAVKYYMTHDPEPEIPITKTTVTKTSVKAILKELLEEMNISIPASTKKEEHPEKTEVEKTSKSEVEAPKEEKPEKKEDVSPEETYSEAELENFLEGLDAWGMNEY